MAVRVVDDLDLSTTHVVRGQDLAPSSALHASLAAYVPGYRLRGEDLRQGRDTGGVKVLFQGLALLGRERPRGVLVFHRLDVAVQNGVPPAVCKHANCRIDIVVVYKIDRLSRALMDFAKLVEVFDRRGVTFVRGPADEAYGRVAVFTDLYGNRWDLIEPV